MIVVAGTKLLERFNREFTTSPDATLQSINEELIKLAGNSILLQTIDIRIEWGHLAFCFCKGLFNIMNSQADFDCIKYFLNELKTLYTCDGRLLELSFVYYNIDLLLSQPIAVSSEETYLERLDALYHYIGYQ